MAAPTPKPGSKKGVLIMVMPMGGMGMGGGMPPMPPPMRKPAAKKSAAKPAAKKAPARKAAAKKPAAKKSPPKMALGGPVGATGFKAPGGLGRPLPPPPGTPPGAPRVGGGRPF